MQHFRLDRWSPGQDLGRFVDRFWKTTWDLPEPFTQSVLGFPAANFVVQSDGSATVTGVLREADARLLDGAGFRPGGFRPFVGYPMNQFTDRRLPATKVFGRAASSLAREVVEAPTDNERCVLFGAFLRERISPEPTLGERISDLVERVSRDGRSTARSSDLAAEFGVSTRTLQRLFREHVGVAPKFVLDRYRRQEVAEVARNDVHSWAEVAQRLGYADQAHLTKDFSKTFGVSPAAYSTREKATQPE